MSINLVKGLRDKIKTLEDQEAWVKAELALLRGMLATPEAREVLARLKQTEEKESAERGEGKRRSAVEVGESQKRRPVWQLAVEILQQAGRPMRLAAMADRIIAGGKEFGGDNPAGSLSSHISQHQDALGQQNGWGYLKEWEESGVEMSVEEGVQLPCEGL